MGGQRIPWPSVAFAWLLACAPAAEPAAPVSSAADPVLEREIEELRDELREQREQNQELTAEVEWLRQQIGAIAALEAGDPAAEPAADDAAGDGNPEQRWFDEAGLTQAGVQPAEIERLRETFARSEMEILELRHRATQEGWVATQRFAEEVFALRSGLRRDLGDESFDLLLYAAGRTNRVVVEDVLQDSPGERAGIETGDVILSYGEERIFRPRELRAATAAGATGDRVTLWVLRDGERVRLHTERGPIGVKLRPAKLLPEELW